MGLYLPPTIDLKKDQLTNKDYGIEHINKILEEELALLKSLKSEKPRESLPILKPNKAEKSKQVEGLNEYRKRVEHSKIEEQTRDTYRLPEHKACIGPFSEAYHDYTKGKRVVAKGEVPFFKLNSDRTSLSYRLPKLTDFQIPKPVNNIISFQTPQIQTPASRRSRKAERASRLSGRLARTHGKLTDSVTSDSEQDSNDITESLKVQYCTITARETHEYVKDEKPFKQEINDSKSENKTFHLACTRDSSKQPMRNEDRECSFCASSVYIHRRYVQSQTSKSRHAKSRQITTAEKAFLPQIKPEVTTKKEEETKECTKCRKRSEQAEQNRISIALTSSQRKLERTSNSISRKAKSRPVSKDTTQQNEATTDVKLPVFECTAYVHEDGSLSLLPGALILNDSDYNVWSRKKETNANTHKLASDTSLPRLVK